MPEDFQSHPSINDCFYGAVTVGERGQIVIPAEAREELGLKSGDKLLVMRHIAWDAVVITKLEHMHRFMQEFAERVEKASTVEAEQ